MMNCIRCRKPSVECKYHVQYICNECIVKCKHCGVLLTADNQHKLDAKYHPKRLCKECDNKITRNKCKLKKRGYELKGHYGITLEDYDVLLKSQNSKCKICGFESDRLHVDHDHSTGQIRGLLCNNCNRGLGLLKDNILVLEKAIEYLVTVKREPKVHEIK